MRAQIAVGRLRVRLTIERAQDVPDDAGGLTRTFVPLADAWGDIVPVGGADRFAGQRIEQTITHVVRLRWRADVTGAVRLRWGARLFVVHAAFDPDERRRLLECRCEEIRT